MLTVAEDSEDIRYAKSTGCHWGVWSNSCGPLPVRNSKKEAANKLVSKQANNTRHPTKRKKVDMLQGLLGTAASVKRSVAIRRPVIL